MTTDEKLDLILANQAEQNKRLTALEEKIGEALNTKVGSVLGSFVKPADIATWKSDGPPARDEKEAELYMLHGFRPDTGTRATEGQLYDFAWQDIDDMSKLDDAGYAAWENGLFGSLDRRIAACLLLINGAPCSRYPNTKMWPYLDDLKKLNPTYAAWLTSMLKGANPLQGPSGE